jgi:hypothetical protein
LPAGKWSVVFSATAAKGPNATLAGPTLTVRAAQPAPTPAPKNIRTPASKPLPKAIPTTATAASTSPPGLHPTPGRPAGTRVPTSSSVAAAHSGPPPSKRPLPAVAIHPSPSATLVRLGNEMGQPSQASGSIVLLLVVPAVGLLAAVGVLLMGRRQSGPGDERTDALRPALQSVIEQPRSPVPRPNRAGRGEDPILAAMGIGTVQRHERPVDGLGGTAAPVTRQVRAGRGERLSRR